jgi:hypothetical protein
MNPAVLKSLLNSFGLGGLIEKAQELANNGTIERGVALLNQLERRGAQLDRIERKLNSILGLEPDTDIADSGAPGGTALRIPARTGTDN